MDGRDFGLFRPTRECVQRRRFARVGRSAEGIQFPGRDGDLDPGLGRRLKSVYRAVRQAHARIETWPAANFTPPV